MKNRISILTILFFISIKSIAVQPFANGADVSWLPQMEATGYVFKNDNGVSEDCLKILKDKGINSIRLRTFVNPSTNRTSGHCSKDETVAMAVRAQQMGMRIMIDFHYSDTWADPAHQAKPAAWVGHSFTELLDDVYNYTFDVMNALKTAGVTPEWVQVGNEIPSGMIYPEGSNESSWTQLIQVINKGYDAIKTVSSTSKVILHVDQGNDNSRFRWWFDNAKNGAAKYDIIGMSYYPYWLSGSPNFTLSINDLGNNLNDMVSRYGKEVMVVEIGGVDTEAQNTFDMLTAVIAKVKAVPNSKGLGVFYWEPEGAKSWSGYSLSAWGNNGQPTIAMNAFNNLTANYTPNESSVKLFLNRQNSELEFSVICSKIEILNLNGMILDSITNSNSINIQQLPKGSYLIRTFGEKSKDVSIFKFIS
ncbi:MAG: glycosyl hydrolase 53 family protein [Paludibacter sp.]|nr:glycosyl hydrolase 53 family protein [Paludibacter sp.]